MALATSPSFATPCRRSRRASTPPGGTSTTPPVPTLGLGGPSRSGGGIGVLVSSTDTKALETAAAIAERWPAPQWRRTIGCARRVRPWIGTGYRAVAHRYLRGELPEGWEPHAAVAARMARGRRRRRRRSAAGAPVVVVSHGLALSIHLGDRLGADFDRESFWSRLAFPDAWALDGDDVLHRSLPGARSPSRSPVGRPRRWRPRARRSPRLPCRSSRTIIDGEERDRHDEQRQRGSAR